ncbi:MAG TPA: M13 family metallopeptidase N-terminal domain-containing protein, partial [Rhodanobacteraceae bacterium]
MFFIRPRVLAAALAFTAIGASAHTNERGLDPQNFDEAVGACTDFFEHADGGWLKSNPIPPEYSQWSLDDELHERNIALLRGILEDAAKNPADAAGSNQRKIGDFYATAMDEAAINTQGYAPIQPRLARVDALRSADDVATLIRDWHADGVPTLFDFGPESDMKNASMMIAYATQGGLGMPDRDYYLRKDAKSKALLAKYRAHVARMLGLIGQKDAGAQAAWVLDLETRLAKSSLDRVALREPENSYHMFTVKDADAKTPHFSWTEFYAKIGHPGLQRFSLAQPDFFVAADQALAGVSVSHWQAYLRWHLVNFAAPYLSDNFVDADFDFYSRTLRGTEQLKPRWKRAIDATNEALGFAVGEAYVAKVFPPEAKQRAEKLVADLKT